MRPAILRKQTEPTPHKPKGKDFFQLNSKCCHGRPLTAFQVVDGCVMKKACGGNEKERSVRECILGTGVLWIFNI